LSSESRRLIQRIVEEQVAHGGTPFELEPPGFPPPPLRQTPSAPPARPKAGAQSTLFHATAAPVAPMPPLPGRGANATATATTPAATPAAPRSAVPPAPTVQPPAPAPAAARTAAPSPAPSPPSPPADRGRVAAPPPTAAAVPATSASRTAVPAATPDDLQLPDFGPSFPELGLPELPIPELPETTGDLLPDVDSWDSEPIEGFDVVDEPPSGAAAAASPPSAAFDVHDDPTLLRADGRDDVPAAAPTVGSGAAGARLAATAAGVSAAAFAGASDETSGGGDAVPPSAAPGGWPRGRGLPSGFDEVARQFSKPAPTAEPATSRESAGEGVRIAPLEMPPAPASSVVAPAPPPTPAPAPPSLAAEKEPVRRPARRRRSALPAILGALVLLLAAGAAVVYFRFPELLPEWARAPQLAGGEAASATPRRPVIRAIGGTPDTAPSAGPAAAATTGSPPPGAASLPAPAQSTATGGSPAPGLPAGGSTAAAGTGSLASTPLDTPAVAGGDGAPRARFSSVEEIWGRRGAAGTVVTIVTNGKVPPDAFSHFRLDGGTPREVIRLRGVDDSYRRTSIAVGTAEVKQLRLGYHAQPGGNELHIVVDLTSPRVQLLQLQPVDNRLELVLAAQ
ncbi:MAG TPA: hypothetical protein VN923_20080, partial [Thermoanaerobaculia bacterium]|nr:hypothetical protein [Thermoanaerobaculia bacterium]